MHCVGGRRARTDTIRASAVVYFFVYFFIVCLITIDWVISIAMMMLLRVPSEGSLVCRYFLRVAARFMVCFFLVYLFSAIKVVGGGRAVSAFVRVSIMKYEQVRSSPRRLLG